MAQPDTTAISEPVKALLGLFESELADVKFPDVDVRVLGESARAVLTAAQRVTEAQGALAAAEAELQNQQEMLLQKAQRALAYVRVYAEESPALMEKVQLIALPRSQRRLTRVEPGSSVSSAQSAEPPGPKRRGRPPKQKSDAPELFADQEVRAELGEAM